MDDKGSQKRNQRLVWTLSGSVDALIGALLLLAGFEILPLDVTQYGLERWVAITLGGIMFIIGVGVAVYNYSRLEE